MKMARGGQHFLLALYEAFGAGHNELIIENKDNITVEEDDTFTISSENEWNCCLEVYRRK